MIGSDMLGRAKNAFVSFRYNLIGQVECGEEQTTRAKMSFLRMGGVKYGHADGK